MKLQQVKQSGELVEEEEEEREREREREKESSRLME
jgi:hypothetical protein